MPLLVIEYLGLSITMDKEYKARNDLWEIGLMLAQQLRPFVEYVFNGIKVRSNKLRRINVRESEILLGYALKRN